MGAPRAWTTVSGQTEASVPLAVVGQEALRTVHYHPDVFSIAIDTTVIPPRVVVSSPPIEELLRDLDTLTDRVTAAEATIVTQAATIASHTTSIGTLTAALALLTPRVTALEALRWTTTPIKTADYTAVAWQHVLVDMDAALGNVSITLPASSVGTAGARVRVSDVSVDGGAGAGFAMRIVCVFATASAGHYAASPYVIASDSANSLIGASIELLDTGAGWFVVSETCRPQQLL
jgi:hypothetical protein